MTTDLHPDSPEVLPILGDLSTLWVSTGWQPTGVAKDDGGEFIVSLQAHDGTPLGAWRGDAAALHALTTSAKLSAAITCRLMEAVDTIDRHFTPDPRRPAFPDDMEELAPARVARQGMEDIARYERRKKLGADAGT